MKDYHTSGPLTVADIDQIVEGIENFCMGPVEDAELIAIWQPYVDKLKAQRAQISAVSELLAALKQVNQYMTHSAMCARTIERAEWRCSCGFNAVYDAKSIAILKAEGRAFKTRESAQPCGCDPGEGWICQEHQTTPAEPV